MKVPRSRKVIAGVGAGVLVLGVGAGAAVAGVAQGDDEAPVSDADAERAREAAVAEAGGGTAREVDREDDGDAAWEVEVARDDGTVVDVHLDGDFAVVAAADDEAGDDDGDESDDSGESGESDDESGEGRPVSAEEADRAATAAVEEVGAGATANGVERADEGDAAWEVEVLREDGSTVDVSLDGDFAVTSVEDDEPAPAG